MLNCGNGQYECFFQFHSIGLQDFTIKIFVQNFFIETIYKNNENFLYPFFAMNVYYEQI